jgi:hypothetical protein
MVAFEKETRLLSPILIILLGMALVGLNIVLYPHFLPQTITSENNYLIQQQGYVFYIVLVGGMITVLTGIRKLYSYYKIRSVKTLNETTSSSFFLPNLTFRSPSSSSSLSKPSIISIIANVAGNRSSFKIFLPVSIGYGVFYSIVSSMLIVRPEGFHHSMGIIAPYAMIMTHGPVGYAPSIALAITDYVGLLIIPINLVILCVVSALVGLNAILLAYAFINRPRKNALQADGSHRLDGSPFMVGVGASSAIFAVCPTCASLYIFGILTGSFASTITSFGVAFYGLFAAISIPLLLISPIVTAFSIRKALRLNACSFKK